MFSIGSRIVSSQHPALIIAELGINHDGNLAVAKLMVDAAKRSGAEIIKHQTHIADEEMSLDAQSIQPDNANQSIYEVIKSRSLSHAEELELKEYVECLGMIFISTPFSLAAVDRLIAFDVPAFKIGSGECNNIPLIEKVARTGKPVILSTGMNNIESIRPSVELLEKYNVPYALLHCTNIYPTPHSEVRLKCLSELREAFPRATIGLSDHTGEIYASLAAIALGANIIEMHFTDTKKRTGPDISCSLDEGQFKELRTASELIHLALQGGKGIVKGEVSVAHFAFASVTSSIQLSKGTVIQPHHVTVKRPATGIPAAELERVFGKTLLIDIPANTTIKREMIAD